MPKYSTIRNSNNGTLLDVPPFITTTCNRLEKNSFENLLTKFPNNPLCFNLYIKSLRRSFSKVFKCQVDHTVLPSPQQINDTIMSNK